MHTSVGKKPHGLCHHMRVLVSSAAICARQLSILKVDCRIIINTPQNMVTESLLQQNNTVQLQSILSNVEGKYSAKVTSSFALLQQVLV